MLPGMDSEEHMYKEWLESTVRCFLEQGSECRLKKAPQKHRLSAYYWLLAVNTSLVNMVQVGLEAFMSQETIDVVVGVAFWW